MEVLVVVEREKRWRAANRHYPRAVTAADPHLDVAFTLLSASSLNLQRPFLPPPLLSIMARNPREQWERLQLILQNRGGRGGFNFPGGGGGGRGNLGLSVALLLVGAGTWAASNSLFNGECVLM